MMLVCSFYFEITWTWFCTAPLQVESSSPYVKTFLSLSFWIHSIFLWRSSDYSHLYYIKCTRSVRKLYFLVIKNCWFSYPQRSFLTSVKSFTTKVLNLQYYLTSYWASTIYQLKFSIKLDCSFVIYIK